MRILLVDLSSLFRPIWESRLQEADTDWTSKTTVARVHEMAHGYEAVAICCDSRKSWRKELAPTYKANRPVSEEPMLHQLRLAQEALKDDGFCVWQAEGFEADDVISAACDQASRYPGLGADVVIASSDKDLTQLVCEMGEYRIRVKSIRTGDVMGPAEVESKFGVPPAKMRDWLCLVGDSSDNVAGVKGVGPKRATELLQKHGSLFDIYANLGDSCAKLGLTPSIYTALKESVEAVELARKLITLRTDVELSFADIFKPRTPKAAPVDMTEDDMETVDGEIVDEVTETKSVPPPKTDEKGADVKRDPGSDRAKLQVVETQTASVQLVKVDWDKELEPRSGKAALGVASALHASRLFQGFGSPEGIFSTIMLGRELGLGAMSSIRGIHLLDTPQGKKHGLSADLMAALVLSSGKAMFFEPEAIEATYAVYTTQRVGRPKPFTMRFDIEEARAAQLTNDTREAKEGRKPGNWEKWAKDMCKARCVARLARAIYPDICFGLYVPEEFESFRDKEAA